METKVVCGLLIGEADSEEKAKRLAQSYKNCPYVAFIGAFSDKFVAAYFIPERHLWWLEYVRDKPKTMGLKTATLLVTDEAKVMYPKEFEPRLPQEKLEVSPCGAICKGCPSFNHCSCCPATIYYKGADFAG